MATIVVHGTMTLTAAQFTKWWWNSWGKMGFLDAVSRGMLEASGRHDVWHIGGREVSEVPALNPKWSVWSGRWGQFGQHRGHFMWDGADMGISREAAAYQLVKYINTLHQISPQEPIRIVAHSHGCNVVKRASADKKLLPGIRFPQAVFLACPHFVGADGKTFTYRLAPQRFGTILNLYSPQDSVQTSFAETFQGLPGGRMADWIPSSSHRMEQDVRARAVYRDYEIPTRDAGVHAHTAMHGALVGYVVGRWLVQGGDFGAAVTHVPRELWPVALGDFGEGV
ncbi:MAG: hypothetical protein PHX83_03535 [Acidobacteriia bacterium]|nr:hypothetical protein [Terriglobia bacterium]